MTLAVYGAESLAAELSQIVKGRSVHNRPAVVQRLKEATSLAGVHVLFVGLDQRKRLPELLATARKSSILVITEWEGALSEGSMINLVMLDGRIRFEVALDVTLRSGLKPSSRLLAVAQQVHTGAP